ncbi:hypothetical protein BU26DRAFT_17564 [Trematosphaeria pertusa]|uniref:Uncharacterized protein n=1 Tax=Trematosphaeria pertusa TaxID=390896 RepID=A0A6A6J1M1_9PLEO|nr:uncharacterized protein BU26DRAFT_17564 [Trematosphaeria pertusa]KAF2256247.1 hypothetical protein BU26DRAFT_17564 [Trematosphaeria pertusa]
MSDFLNFQCLTLCFVPVLPPLCSKSYRRGALEGVGGTSLVTSREVANTARPPMPIYDGDYALKETPRTPPPSEGLQDGVSPSSPSPSLSGRL